MPTLRLCAPLRPLRIIPSRSRVRQAQIPTNGLSRFSWPIVVAGPWPGSRIVVSGTRRASRGCRRSVAQNSRQGNRSAQCCRQRSRRRQRPGTALASRTRTRCALPNGRECPGPASQCRPAEIRSPSLTVTSAGGLVIGKPKAAERFCVGSVSLGASPAPMTSRQSGHRSFRTALPPI